MGSLTLWPRPSCVFSPAINFLSFLLCFFLLKMNTLTSTSLCNYQVLSFRSRISNQRNVSLQFRTSSVPSRICFRVCANVNANTNELEAEAEPKQEIQAEAKEVTKSATSAIDQDLKKVVQKTAATFAPRASTASKNPAVPGSVLYTVFEVQAYVCMLLGGVLSFNLVFPSNEPDLWRLMGMWSIWMFTIPSLRARDCSKNEKEALNYLFLLVPLLNVTIPFFIKSFAVVWSADTIAFFAMYAWKMGWQQTKD